MKFYKSFYTKVKIWVPLKSIHVIDNLTVGKANKSFHSESYILISKKNHKCCFSYMKEDWEKKQCIN
jgi:hypothetical protein